LFRPRSPALLPAVPAPGRELAGVIVACVVPVLVLLPPEVLAGFVGTCVAFRAVCPGAAVTCVGAAGEALAWAVAARPCGAVERPGFAAAAGRSGTDRALAAAERLAFVLGVDALAPALPGVFVTVAGEAAAGGGVERVVAGTTTAAGTAGTRSAADGGRGSGRALRVGGAAAIWSGDPNGRCFAGPTPSPPRTISESQTSASSATSRPTKRK
jgi:hypothetical protein